MKHSQDVEKIVMPLTIIWLMLTASIFIYGGLLIYLGKNSFVDVQSSNLKNTLMPLSFAPFILSFIFHKKLSAIVRKTNMDKSPFARGLSEVDKKTLEYFGAYFVVHIVLWAFNESAAILGFVLSVTTGNIQYFILPASIAVFFNLVLMRPKYFDFIEGRKFE